MTEKVQRAIHLTTMDVTFVAIFAGLYAVLGYIPLFYILGTYGQYMSANLIIVPIIGIVLGPVGGTLAAAIGGVIGMIVTGNMPLSVFSFLPGTFHALCIGLTFRGKRYASATIFAVFILAFTLLPSIGAVKYFVWLHVFALLLLLSAAPTLAVKYVKGTSYQKLLVGVGILAFIGVLIQHIVGSFIFQLLTVSDEHLWATLAFFYPIERLLATIVVAIIGAGVVRGVKASGFKIGQAIA